MWSYFYFAYHLSIAIWIILALIVGYAWADKQPASLDETIWFWMGLFILECFIMRLKDIIAKQTKSEIRIDVVARIKEGNTRFKLILFYIRNEISG